MYSIKNTNGEWLGWNGHRYNALYLNIFKPTNTGHTSAHRFDTHRKAVFAVRRLLSLGYKQDLKIVEAPNFPEPDAKDKEVAAMFIDE